MSKLNLTSVFAFGSTFPSEEACIDLLAQTRWPDEVVCPLCDNKEYQHKIYKNKDRTYSCSACRKQFSVRKKTIFERSHFDLKQWFYAMYLMNLSGNGISSVELAKQLNCTQSNAWFLLSRIRKAMGNSGYVQFEGEVEADESFFGGKNRNRHKNKRIPHTHGRSLADKAAVYAIMERGQHGRVFVLRLSKLTGKSLRLFVKTKVKHGSIIHTDEFKLYRGLNEWFDHRTCDHKSGQYVNGDSHTNTVESFWSRMKGGVQGTYRRTTRHHLFLYCKEFEFRHNNRNSTKEEQFIQLIKQSFDVRLTYKNLTGRTSTFR